MRTVGQILKEEREKQFYKIEEVEKVTKIRKELLEALEAGDYTKLPPPTFTQGFIKSYGKFLNLDIEKLLAVFRREYSEHINPPKISSALSNPVGKNKLQLTPTKLISAAVLFLALTFFAYLWFEYRFLVGTPFLQVTQPIDQASIETDNVKVIGKTDPEAKITINSQQIQVDFSGDFGEEIKLTESVNKIEVIATSKSGKTTKIERTVFIKR